MQVFYCGWGIVQQFIFADANMPKEVNLPTPSHRQVANELVRRREFPILDVIDALTPLAQPELLITHTNPKSITSTGKGEILLDGLISPVPLTMKSRSYRNSRGK